MTEFTRRAAMMLFAIVAAGTGRKSVRAGPPWESRRGSETFDHNNDIVLIHAP